MPGLFLLFCLRQAALSPANVAVLNGAADDQPAVEQADDGVSTHSADRYCMEKRTVGVTVPGEWLLPQHMAATRRQTVQPGQTAADRRDIQPPAADDRSTQKTMMRHAVGGWGMDVVGFRQGFHRCDEPVGTATFGRRHRNVLCIGR